MRQRLPIAFAQVKWDNTENLFRYIQQIACYLYTAKRISKKKDITI